MRQSNKFSPLNIAAILKKFLPIIGRGWEKKCSHAPVKKTPLRNQRGFSFGGVEQLTASFRRYIDFTCAALGIRGKGGMITSMIRMVLVFSLAFQSVAPAFAAGGDVAVVPKLGFVGGSVRGLHGKITALGLRLLFGPKSGPQTTPPAVGESASNVFSTVADRLDPAHGGPHNSALTYEHLRTVPPVQRVTRRLDEMYKYFDAIHQLVWNEAQSGAETPSEDLRSKWNVTWEKITSETNMTGAERARSLEYKAPESLEQAWNEAKGGATTHQAWTFHSIAKLVTRHFLDHKSNKGKKGTHVEAMVGGVRDRQQIFLSVFSPSGGSYHPKGVEGPVWVEILNMPLAVNQSVSAAPIDIKNPKSLAAHIALRRVKHHIYGFSNLFMAILNFFGNGRLVRYISRILNRLTAVSHKIGPRFIPIEGHSHELISRRLAATRLGRALQKGIATLPTPEKINNWWDGTNPLGFAAPFNHVVLTDATAGNSSYVYKEALRHSWISPKWWCLSLRGKFELPTVADMERGLLSTALHFIVIMCSAGIADMIGRVFHLHGAEFSWLTVKWSLASAILWGTLQAFYNNLVRSNSMSWGATIRLLLHCMTYYIPMTLSQHQGDWHVFLKWSVAFNILLVGLAERTVSTAQSEPTYLMEDFHIRPWPFARQMPSMTARLLSRLCFWIGGEKFNRLGKKYADMRTPGAAYLREGLALTRFGTKSIAVIIGKIYGTVFVLALLPPTYVLTWIFNWDKLNKNHNIVHRIDPTTLMRMIKYRRSPVVNWVANRLRTPITPEASVIKDMVVQIVHTKPSLIGDTGLSPQELLALDLSDTMYRQIEHANPEWRNQLRPIVLTNNQPGKVIINLGAHERGTVLTSIARVCFEFVHRDKILPLNTPWENYLTREGGDDGPVNGLRVKIERPTEVLVTIGLDPESGMFILTSPKVFNLEEFTVAVREMVWNAEEHDLRQQER